jgi:hypothetical protein
VDRPVHRSGYARRISTPCSAESEPLPPQNRHPLFPLNRHPPLYVPIVFPIALPVVEPIVGQHIRGISSVKRSALSHRVARSTATEAFAATVDRRRLVQGRDAKARGFGERRTRADGAPEIAEWPVSRSASGASRPRPVRGRPELPAA